MSYDAVSLINRVAQIAGKHRSHRFRRSSVGARLPAMNDNAEHLPDPVARWPQCPCTVHATSRATIGRTINTQMNAEGIATW